MIARQKALVKQKEEVLMSNQCFFLLYGAFTHNTSEENSTVNDIQ